jgi:enoyl reductase
MRAAVFDHFGPPEVLRIAELPDPEPGPGELRVRVRAAGVQPFDVKVRRGEMSRLPVRFPQTIGQEYAGVVDRVGEGVPELRIGDDVLGSTMLNGNAALVCVPAGTAVTKPADLDAGGGGAIAQSIELGIARERIGTITDDQAAAEHGARVVRAGRDPARLAEVVALAARGPSNHPAATLDGKKVLMLPIRAYPLAEVAEAHAAVETRHGRGKVVLIVG